MKKLFFFFLLLFAGFGLMSVSAQSPVEVTIGTGTSTNYNSPFNNFYKNSWNEYIYLSSEIGQLGFIQSIAYNCSASASFTFATLKIYMGHTSRSAIANTTDWTPMSDLTLVYDGTNIAGPSSTGWFTLNLDNPFFYNGSDNLVVVVSKTTAAYSSSLKWYYGSVTGRALYRKHDTDASYANHPGSATGTTLSEFPNTKLTLTTAGLNCLPPQTLTVENITGTGAQVSWSTVANALEYIMQYKTSNQTWDNAVTVTSLTDTTYDLTGLLSPTTTYDVRVAVDCGSGDTSFWKNKSFTTPCMPISQFPFSENFDSYTGSTSGTANNLPSCWNYLNNGTSTSYVGYPIMYSSTAYAESGNNSLRYYTTTGTSYGDQIAILPPVDVTQYPMNTITLSFDARNNSSYTFRLVVGVMSNPADKTTFVPIDTVVTTSNDYSHYEFLFDQYTGTGSYIALMAPQPASSYNSGYVDNIVMDVLPSCPHPYHITSSNPTLNSIDLSWTEVGTATSWEIIYGPMGFDPDSAGTVETVTSLPHTVANLSPSTLYDFYVRSNCGSEYSEMSPVYTAGTQCAPISQLPFTENFDGYAGYTSTTAAESNVPYCWYNLNNGSSTSYSGYPIIYRSSSVAASGTNAVRFYTYITAGTYDDQMLILPQVDVTQNPLNTLQLSFDARNQSTYTFELVVGVMTDPAVKSTFVPVDTIVTTSNNYTHYEIPFVRYTGTGAYIALMAPRPATSYNNGLVDNIVLDVLPTCPKPYKVTASNITTNSITLSWTELGTATTWQLEYGPVGFTPGVGEGTVVTVSSLPYTLSGLNHSTRYDFYVSANCGSETSGNTLPMTLATGCAPISQLPFFENFDTYDGSTNTTMPTTIMPICWDSHSSSTTSSYQGYPFIYNNSTYSNSGNNSLRFYSYYYSTSSSTSHYGDQVAILPPVDTTLFPINTLQLMFDFRTSATTYAFNVQVGVMTDPTNMSTFTPVQTVTTSATTYSTKTVSFSNFTGSGSYIALKVAEPTTSSSYNYGYIDNVLLENIPPCPRPTHVQAISTPSDTVILTWSDPNSSSWDIMWGPTGFDPNSSNVTVEYAIIDTFHAFSGLTLGMGYDFYVRANCNSGDVGPWTMVPATGYPYTYTMGVHGGLTGTDTVTSCGFTVTDDGGPNGVYSNNCNYTLVIYPTDPDSVVSISGVFAGESSIDYLSIYSGTEVEENSLIQKIYSSMNGGSTGDQINFGPFNSEVGPLTLLFHSDGSIVSAGFVAQVTCAEAPACPKPFDVSADNVTDNSAELTWDFLSTSSSSFTVTLSTQSANFNPDTCSNLDYSATNGISLSNLVPNTVYYVKVQADCGVNVSEWSNVYTFRTACVPYTTMPFVENFDSYSGTTNTSMSVTNLPSCWTNFCNGSSTSYTGYPIIYNSSTYSQSGSNSMRFYSYSTVGTYGDEIAILPMFDPSLYPVNTLQISFDYRASSTSYNFNLVVGVMGNPSDRSTFVALDTINSTSATYQSYEFMFSQYTGNGNYIALMAPRPATSYNQGYVDNIRVEPIPTCPKPTNLTANTIGSNSVELAWTENGTANEWEIEYGPVGFTPGNNVGTVETATTNPFTVPNLTPATTYDFYIRANCSTEYSYYSPKLTLTTGCVPIAQLPFNEDFESYTAGTSSSQVLPVCWSSINYGTSATGCPTVYTSTTYAAPGGNGRCLYFYTTSASYHADQIAVLPDIDVNLFPINTLRLSFDARKYDETATYVNYVEVGVIEGVSTFVPVDTVTFTSTVVSTHHVDFSNYNGTGTRIAIRAPKPTGSFSYNYTYLDNIKVALAPSCPDLTNLHIASLSASSVELAWTDDASESSWEVLLIPANQTPDYTQAQTVNGTPTYTASALNGTTQYKAYVRTVCSNNLGYNDWQVLTFATPSSAPAQLPYFHDFDDGVENAEWVILNSTRPNKWYIGMPTGATDSILYVSNDTGATNNYTIASENTTIWAYRDIQFGAGAEFQIKFNWRCYGESSYDFLKVYLGTPTLVEAKTTSSLYNTTTDDPAGTIALEPKFNLSGSWVTYTGVIPSTYANSVQRLYFRWTNDGSGGTMPPAAVDSIFIIPMNCGRPVNVAASGITTTSANITFTPASSTDGGWEYVYTNSSSVDPNTLTPAPLSTTTFTLSGLSASSTYYVYVRTDCGAGEYSGWSQVTTFTTECGEITLPYTENFDSYTTTGTSSHPLCWTWNSTYSASYPYISSSYYSSGNRSLYFYGATSGTYSLIAAPEIASTYAMNTVKVSVQFRVPSYTSIGLIVGAMSNPMDVTTFVPMDTLYNTSTSAFESHTVSFASYTGTGHYVAFMSYHPSNSGALYMDDVLIEEDTTIAPPTPTCDMPTGLAVAAATITQTSATATWTAGGSETAWDVQVKAHSANQWGNATPTQTTSFNITGLTAGTQYDVRVRANCGDATSDWTTAVTFQTLAQGQDPCNAPTGLTATDMTKNSVKLDWAQVGNNVVNWTVIYKEENAAQSSSATATEHPYTLTGLQPATTYTVNVVANCADGQSDPSNTVTFTTLPDGINDYELATSLYPNPNNGQFTINNEQFTIKNVDVYDVYGKLLKTVEVNANSVMVDANELSAGMYFVRISTEKGVVTKSFVKK